MKMPKKCLRKNYSLAKDRSPESLGLNNTQLNPWIIQGVSCDITLTRQMPFPDCICIDIRSETNLCTS